MNKLDADVTRKYIRNLLIYAFCVLEIKNEINKLSIKLMVNNIIKMHGSLNHHELAYVISSGTMGKYSERYAKFDADVIHRWVSAFEIERKEYFTNNKVLASMLQRTETPATALSSGNDTELPFDSVEAYVAHLSQKWGVNNQDKVKATNLLKANSEPMALVKSQIVRDEIRQWCNDCYEADRASETYYNVIKYPDNYNNESSPFNAGVKAVFDKYK